MFLEFGLVDQFNIPYKVRLPIKCISLRPKCAQCGLLGSVPLGFERQKELPTRELSQLAARAQRLSDHVHCFANGENGPVYGRFGDLWSSCGLPLSRLGPSRHQQCFPIQSRIATGHPLFNVNNGASPFRPMRHDSQLPRKQHFPGTNDTWYMGSLKTSSI